MSGSPPSRSPSTLRERVEATSPPPALAALLLVTAGALVVRLYDLGWRVAHQDEGRVGDWIIHYVRSGHWEYKPIIHGPFLPHVNGVLFPVVGATDFTARLVVALVGGLLPLSAWLFREHLRDEAVVALGAILALNPILVYYSRFMRNDVLLAAFAFVAVGFAVRAIDTRRVVYVHAAAIALGLAFTTKENALLYPMAWLGALALVIDHRLLSVATRAERTTASDTAGHDGRHGPPDAGDGGLLDRVLPRTPPAWTTRGATGLARARAGAFGAWLWRWRLHAVAAIGEFLLVVVLFYAPLPDLWNVVADPASIPRVVEEATWGSWQKFMGTWGDPGMREHSYIEFARYFVGVLHTTATPLLALAALGVGWARYVDGERPLVDFATYWGVASVVGYPLVMDIQAAWVTAHAVVPLAIPAAVGAGVLARQFTRLAAGERVDAALVALAAAGGLVAVRTLTDRGVDALRTGDTTALVAAAAVVLLALAAVAIARGGERRRPTATQVVGGIAVAALALGAIQAGGLVHDTAFERPQSAENPLVQYAQPSGQMQPTLARMYELSRENTEGPDLLYYGDRDSRYCNQLVQPTEEWSPPDDPPCGWFSRLPLPWYTSANDVTTASESDAQAVLDDPAPVVVALDDSAYSVGGNVASDIEGLTDQGYREVSHQGYLWGRELVFYVREG